jgi:thioredoxin-related protein
VRRGVHELAYLLLDGKISYPSVVFLDEEFSRIRISPGFKQVDQFMKELIFAADNHYKQMSWKQFQSNEQ